MDRDKEIIRGMVIAQEGPFKSEGWGEFDADSLRTIHQLTADSPNGLKSRLGHPTDEHDGIGHLLGRVKDPWIDTLGARESEGSSKLNAVKCVRADLHINPAAHKGPFDLAEWLMTACENDPDAISSSLVLSTDQEWRINQRTGRPEVDEDGVELAPLWRPTALHAADVVDAGDAVDGILSALAKAKLSAGEPSQDSPGSPNQPEGSSNNPYPSSDDNNPLSHNGCKSTLGYHHISLCRLCGKEVMGCKCDNRDNESGDNHDEDALC